MKYLLPTALALIVATSCYGQMQYKFPEKFNPFYDFKPDEAYSLILKDNPKEDKNNLDFFAVNYVYEEQFGFDYGRHYMDWVDVENYFIKIMNRVLPKHTDKKNLNFFFSRSIEENAYASRFGNLYLTLGMFCIAENEAFIAGVLAHEAGHYFFNHNITSQKEYSDMRQYVGYGSPQFFAQKKEALERFYAMKRELEYQADTFAIATLLRAGVDIRPMLNYQEQEDMREQITRFSRSYQNMLKASQLTDTQLKKRKNQARNPLATHASSIERFDLVKQAMEKNPQSGQTFMVDSSFFWRLKRLALEERKRICFESAMFDDCAFFSTIDYMQDPKNLKNLYFIFESTRRLLMIRPELRTKGFLSDLVYDDYLYYNNKSIFHKPAYILNTSDLYNALSNHPFVISEKRPFETYEQAFFYFVQEGIRRNFNEANMSLGLYYQYLGKKDSAQKYLQAYVNNGNGLYKNLAESILKEGHPTIAKGKSMILYNTMGIYTGTTHNYYLVKRHRELNNPAVHAMFGKDSIHNHLVMVNELVGKNPYRLNEMKKLMIAVLSLYNEDDIQTYKKIRLRSSFAGEDSPLAASSQKHLFVYAPEWYNWFNEQGYDKLFFVDAVYQYSTYAAKTESFNTYTGYYLDFNLKRPYFRDASRVGVNFKQKEKEILKELNSFLYE